MYSTKILAGCRASALAAATTLVLVLGGCPDSSQIDSDGSVVSGITAGGDPNAPGQGSGSDGVGDGPAVIDVAAATPQDAAVTIELRGSSPSGLELEFEIVSPPVQGVVGEIAVVDDLSAAVVYTPPVGYTGQARFSYRATDGVEESAVGSVVVFVYQPISFELDRNSGLCPLTVQARAYNVSGEPLPEGQYCWQYDGQEDCGDMASHGQRTLTFAKAGIYYVSLTVTIAGLSEPLACTTGRGKPATRVKVTVTDARSISGYVRDANGSPLAGLSVAAEGSLSTSATDSKGKYGVSVPVGWSGTVSVSDNTRTFEPASRTYTAVQADQADQDFTALPESVPPPMGLLAVSPAAALTASGQRGGTFTPSAATYTLTNSGEASLDWSAAKTQSWVTLSKISGTLAAGVSDTVQVAINAQAAALAVGAYSDAVTFVNTTSGAGNAARDVTLSVIDVPPEPGALSVSGSGGLSSSGLVGGLFTPASVAYTLTNTGQEAVSWSAAKTRTWVTLSKASGSLAAGASDTVTVTINANANALAAGGYSDTVTFTNSTNGTGNTTRAVALTVIQPAALGVSPATALTSAGLVGGSFSPTSRAYTLTNTGGQTLSWTAAKTRTWVTLSKASGSLAVGASDTVTVSINANANALAAGSYSDTVTFTNTTNGTGNTTRAVSLTVTAPAALAVSPATGLSSSGAVGGPFSPASQAYTLTNTGGQAMSWTAAKTQSWTTLSKTSGSLAAGATDTVTVSINANANALAASSYSDIVTFTNSTNGTGNTTRAVALSVTAVSDCVTSSTVWQNAAFAAQSGLFVVEFDVTPGAANVDGVIGLSAAAATSYTSCAALVRFNTSGTIDVRNGGSYVADATVSHTAGTSYHFRVVANVTAHTYSVYVTPASGSEQELAASYAFRTEQSAVTSLANWAVIAETGSLEVCDFAIQVPAGVLAISPAGGLSGSGAVGGPFSPASQIYTLMNSGGQAINWTAAKTQGWVTLSKSSGTLAAGASDTVTVSINANANALAVGGYSDVATFVNTTNGSGNTTRAVALGVSAVLPLAANAGADQTITSGSSVVLAGAASGGTAPYTYSWSPATGLSATNVAQPTASPATTTTYTLTVTDSQSNAISDSVTVTVATGTVYYVATNGAGASDSNAGTAAAPWKTLAKAASTALAGSTVFVRAGTYSETLTAARSGTVGALITFKAYPGELPVIAKGIVLSSADYVRIEGFDITNTTANRQGITIQDYYATAIRRGLQIVNNRIRDCTGPDFGRGVDAYSVSDLLVEGNEITNNANTAVFLSGRYSGTNNVNIVVRNNYIHYNGQDGVHPEGQQIVIENNRIGNQFHTASHQDAIEVYGPIDGLMIRNNLIWDTTQNIYLSAENSYLRNIEVIGNVVWSQNYTGQSIAGFNVGPNVADITNLRIEGNTFANVRCLVTDSYAQDASYRITGLKINNNIFYKSLMGVSVVNDFPCDYNLHYYSGADIISWNGGWYSSLATFRAANPTKQVHGLQADPLFVNAAGYDLHLGSGSPAINVGMAVSGLSADPDGVPRPSGGGYDIGGYERP